MARKTKTKKASRNEDLRSDISDSSVSEQENDEYDDSKSGKGNKNHSDSEATSESTSKRSISTTTTKKHDNVSKQDSGKFDPFAFQDNELNSWHYHQTPRYITRDLFKPYKNKNPSITEEVDDSHCSDNVVWTIANIFNNDELPTHSPNVLNRSRAKQWLIQFLKQTKKVMKQMAEVQYFTAALNPAWLCLLKGENEPPFTDFNQLSKRLQDRTDETAWKFKYETPDPDKLAEDFLSHHHLFYRGCDKSKRKSFINRLAIYSIGEVKRTFMPNLKKTIQGQKVKRLHLTLSNV